MNPARPFLTFATMASLSAALALQGASGCGDDETSSGTTGTTGPSTLSGVLRYERVPRNMGQEGLDYASVTPQPIRGARVQLLNAADGAMIAETVSGEDGAYSFNLQSPARVRLWIFAETTTPSITVEDNTADNAVYVLESAEVDTAGTRQLDVLATTGWGGSAYTGPRAAAPFAILDMAYEAARRFRTEINPPPDFPPLKLNWSVDNRPEDGSVTTGQIGNSHWDGAELYILGKDGVDTDEFDTHVIVHEWGHYFESKLSRSDSLGGSHSYGDILDPRVALSEGWGNALSAMILDPDTVYADAIGPTQSEGFSYDLEANDTSADAVPGWFSEATVEEVLFDLYDGANEPFDGVEVGLPGVYDAMIGPVESTRAMTTLFAFLAGMKTQRPGDAQAIDDLTIFHTYDAAFGLDPVQDMWGLGETHTGGFPGTLPVYIDGVLGGSYTVSLTGGADYNMLAQNRFIRFTGQGASVTVTSTCVSDVDLYVYRDGIEVASAASVDGNEQVTFNGVSGTTYIVNVQGFDSGTSEYTALIDITP